jgi:hypothetical protein
MIHGLRPFRSRFGVRTVSPCEVTSSPGRLPRRALKGCCAATLGGMLQQNRNLPGRRSARPVPETGSSVHSRVIPSAGSCFYTGSVRNRHLMGFEEDRSANLSRVVYATKRRFGLT